MFTFMMGGGVFESTTGISERSVHAEPASPNGSLLAAASELADMFLTRFPSKATSGDAQKSQTSAQLIRTQACRPKLNRKAIWAFVYASCISQLAKLA